MESKKKIFIKEMKVLFTICGRAGSKGIKNKARTKQKYILKQTVSPEQCKENQDYGREEQIDKNGT